MQADGLQVKLLRHRHTGYLDAPSPSCVSRQHWGKAMDIRYATQHRRMPWKNGKGSTIEIAIDPPGAGLDDFNWRISMAGVTEDGAFSTFPGVDRILVLLSGDGLGLQIGDSDELLLTLDSAPYTFSGNMATRARLLGRPVTDLNVMIRRNRCQAEVTLLQAGPKTTTIPAPIGHLPTFILCTSGQLDLGIGQARQQLHPGDCARLDSQDHPVRLVGDGGGLQIRLSPAQMGVR